MERETQVEEKAPYPESGPIYYAEFPDQNNAKLGKLRCGVNVMAAIIAASAWRPSKDKDIETELEQELYLYRLEVDRKLVEHVEDSNDLLVTIGNPELQVVLVAKIKVYEYRWLGEVLGLEYYNKDCLFMGLYIETSEKLWGGITFIQPGRNRLMALRSGRDMAITEPVHLSGKARSERTLSDYQLLDLKSVTVPNAQPQLEVLFYNQVLDTFKCADQGKDVDVSDSRAVVIDLSRLYVDCLYASIDSIGNVAKRLEANVHLGNIQEICIGIPFDCDVLFPQDRSYIVAFYLRGLSPDYRLKSGTLSPTSPPVF